MTHRKSAPHIHRDDRNRLRLIAGVLSGIACLALVPTLYGLAVLVSDSLFGPVTMHPTYERGLNLAHEMTRQAALQRWIGGLLVAFMGGLALLVSGGIRSRRKLSVKQYWAVTLLLVVFALVAPFVLRSLG